jgi:hypothetical protein
MACDTILAAHEHAARHHDSRRTMRAARDTKHHTRDTPFVGGRMHEEA